MLETKNKQIGANEYQVTQLGAIQGRKVLARLARVIGPAIAEVGTGGVTAALAKAAEGLTDADVDYFCETFAPMTHVRMPDGKTPKLSQIFDFHFAANYLELTKWLGFCLEVNFGSFFDELQSRAKAEKQTAPQA